MSSSLKTLIILGVAGWLAACSGASGAPKAKQISEACQMSSNLGDRVCSCVGEMAMTELSEDGRIFLDASLRKDEARAKEASRNMSMEETVTAGTFMVRAPVACASESG
ncbi:MAG: hypothetical protein AAGA69_06680 [Pseudomonadota bacterium]